MVKGSMLKEKVRVAEKKLDESILDTFEMKVRIHILLKHPESLSAMFIRESFELYLRENPGIADSMNKLYLEKEKELKPPIDDKS